MIFLKWGAAGQIESFLGIGGVCLFVIYLELVNKMALIISFQNGQKTTQAGSRPQNQHPRHQKKTTPRRRPLLPRPRRRRRQPLPPRRRLTLLLTLPLSLTILLTLLLTHTTTTITTSRTQHAVSRTTRHQNELPHQPQKRRGGGPLLGTAGQPVLRRS